MKLRLLLWKGRHDNLDLFMEQMHQASIKKGISCYVANTNEPESYSGEAFFRFLRTPGCVMLTFNQIGSLLSVGGENLYKKYSVPVYSMIQDHPRNFTDALRDPVCDLRAVCLDLNHVDFIKRFYPKVEYVFYQPSGGTESGKGKRYHERSIDVLYGGDCQRQVDVFPQITGFADEGSDFYSRTIVKMIQDPEYTTEDAIEATLNEMGCVYSEELLRDFNEQVAMYIEEVVRRHFKQNAMRALDQAGIHVEVYGGGWEAEDYEWNTVKIHERVTGERFNELMGDARIVLNFVPWFKRGNSERVFNTMLNKSLCIVDRNEYLESRFKDGRELIFFDLTNPQQLAADVRWLLEHPDVSEKIAQTGYQVASEKDTWGERLETLLPLICDTEHLEV